MKGEFSFYNINEGVFTKWMDKNRIPLKVAIKRINEEAKYLGHINKLDLEYIKGAKLIEKGLIYIKQEEIKGISLYEFIKRNSEEKLRKAFYGFGRDLAILHNETKILHGDLCEHNILVNKNKLILLDPAPRKGKIVEDLAKLYLSITPLNPIQRLRISYKYNTCRNALVNGYMSFNAKEIGFIQVYEESLKQLSINRRIMKDGRFNLFKELLIEANIRLVMKEIWREAYYAY